MNALVKRIEASPIWVRVVPFAVFLGLTFFQGRLGEASDYWVYGLKTLFVGWLLWRLRRALGEMKWSLSWEAVVVGISVCIMWVGLEPLARSLGMNETHLRLGEASHLWNPLSGFSQDPFLGWTFVLARILGSALLVPLLEEVFFRSFLYRYIAKPDFQSVPLGAFVPMPFVITSVIFGFEHREWLAGILCGLAYQGLVCRKQRLGDAITAHAITNFLLGLWVVWQGAWQYW